MVCRGFMAGLGVGTAAGIVAGDTGSDTNKGGAAPFLLTALVGRCHEPEGSRRSFFPSG